MIYFFITKPAFTPEDWRAAKKTYRDRAPALAAAPKGGTTPAVALIESAAVYLGPEIQPGDSFADAVERAFLRGRAAPGLLCRRKELAVTLGAALAPEINARAPLETHVWALLMKSGVIVYLTVARITDPADAPGAAHFQAKHAFESMVRGALSGPMRRDLEIVTKNEFGAERPISLDFAKAPSFTVAIYDDSQGASADVEHIHRLEDGAAQDRAEPLSLRNLGVSRAYLGFGNASFVARDPRLVAALLPPIVFVDSLYSLNSFIGDRRDEPEFASPGAKRRERLATIEDRIERNRRQSREFQEIDAERLRIEGSFKPWQWSVYAALFEHWRMAQLITSTQDAMRMRYERDASLLELRVARSARRQNAILLSLVSLQIFSVGMAIGDAALKLDASRIEMGDWRAIAAIGAPLAGLVIGITVALALLNENR